MLKSKMALGIASVAIVGAIGIGGTLAWFTSAVDTTNTVTFGNVEIKAKAPTPEQNGIMPGTIYDASATVENTGANGALLRAKITVTNDPGDANQATLTDSQLQAIEDNLNINKVVGETAQTAGWVKGQGEGNEDYYYYVGASADQTIAMSVAPNSDVEALYTKGMIPAPWNNTGGESDPNYIKGSPKFKINVEFQALQADNVVNDETINTLNWGANYNTSVVEAPAADPTPEQTPTV